MSFIGFILSPSGLVYALCLAGLASLPWTRTRRFSLPLLAPAALLIVVFSSGKTATALMSPLEYAYSARIDPAQHPEVRDIVALTGWAADDPDMPLTGRGQCDLGLRLLRVLELKRQCAECRVIVSGTPTTARIMGDILRELGVPDAQLTIDGNAPHTDISARNLRPLVGTRPFFLVTSGGHLPRTLEAMKKNGLAPIPMPTDHQMPREWSRAKWEPSSTSLVVSDRAVHEYLGWAWYRLRGS